MIAHITPLHEIRNSSQFINSLPEPKVLAGGCFDIIHKGHLAFLSAARNEGSYLIILLESDEDITRRKGEKRPHNPQQVRATNLADLGLIDLIILLPGGMKDIDYENVVSLIKPAIIATTKGDPYRMHKELYAKGIGGKVIDVIDRLPDYSTTSLLENKYESQ